ncbi:Glycine--tRNA ligase 1, mitochondrial [Spiromyces aspiralis]|uniref:Glycine--tRNA ligase 1, mitochondrial n=1 Tax=Spiromyces aspiralis TaxID=68401 RepID=A0ACC1HV49_9FUNG|nr:Glycine--tRNA ligase 1, mitochondrial [Spiromyces aspiralis]
MTAAPGLIKKGDAESFDRAALEALLTKRFFFAPSFEIYGGVAGLYDYGPTGNALLQNLVQHWRQHFVIEENMLEVDCSIMTPADVLKTSGHVDKFSDYMVRDSKDPGSIFRADHLVEAVLEARLKGDAIARAQESHGSLADKIDDLSVNDKKNKKKAGKKAPGEVEPKRLDDAVIEEYKNILAQIDNYDGKGLAALITKYDIRNPETGNPVTEPVEFNLMFSSSIGPTGQLQGYLRPETAQGQFLNFGRLLDFNNNKLPFASAMVGRAFRNEISPRSGLLRVREFTMAEIEHFVDPEKKDHPRFNEVKHLVLPFLDKGTQTSGSTEPTLISIEQAVASGTVANQTLGYFIGRIYLYLVAVGINPNRLRFRQHLQNEMAHYACDCWDAEIHTSYGWIECVGCADRSAYDLTVHSKRTKQDLSVSENLREPRIYDKWVVEINKKKFGPQFKKDAKVVTDYLESRTECELEDLAAKMAANGGSATFIVPDGREFTVNGDLVEIKKVTVKEHIRKYTPNVIEPSFGIGRILYSLLEHSYYTRPEDVQRGVMGFSPLVAPFKCLVLPLSNHTSFESPLLEIARQLRRLGVPARIDDSASASIGRRYARNDELGTPFAITVDFQTVDDGTVTLRERDSTKQIRGPRDEIILLVKQLVDGVISWDNATTKYPLVNTATSDDERD